MEAFGKIDKLRKTHNFPTRMYRRAVRDLEKKEDLDFDPKLEINTSKFFESGSLNYLKKNKRLLKKQQEGSGSESFTGSYSQLYTKYTEALLTRSSDLLVEVRTALQNYSAFVEELDAQLSGLDFDTSKLKYKHQWHDLEILFNSEEKANEFKNKTLTVKDTKYNSLLVKHILNVENKREQLDKLITKDSSRIRCISGKVNTLLKSIEGFLRFLKDNYVESGYLEKIKKETERLKEFYGSLLEGRKVETFEVPEYFKEISEEIVNSSSSLAKDKKKIKKEILTDLEKYFLTTTPLNVPFIPDFYDIAYDYIKYPPVDEKLEEVFMNLNLSQLK